MRSSHDRAHGDLTGDGSTVFDERSEVGPARAQRPASCDGRAQDRRERPSPAGYEREEARLEHAPRRPGVRLGPEAQLAADPPPSGPRLGDPSPDERPDSVGIGTTESSARPSVCRWNEGHRSLEQLADARAEIVQAFRFDPAKGAVGATLKGSVELAGVDPGDLAGGVCFVELRASGFAQRIDGQSRPLRLSSRRPFPQRLCFPGRLAVDSGGLLRASWSSSLTIGLRPPAGPIDERVLGFVLLPRKVLGADEIGLD